MSSINIDVTEFIDIINLFMLDALQGKLKVEDKRFNDLTKKITNAGLKSVFYKQFLEMPGTSKVKYRQIKDVFEKKGSKAGIFISHGVNESLLDDIVKRTVQLTLEKENPNPIKLNLLTEILKEEYK